MKVNNVSGPLSAYNQQKTRKVSSGGALSRSEKSDKVSLSKEAQEVLGLKEKVAQVSDVRTDRVEDLRQQISAGTYQVNARDVAARMLKSKVLSDLL